MGHTVIEVHSIIDNKTQAGSEKLDLSTVDTVQDDCDEILEKNENSIAGKYEEYGNYPSDEVMKIKDKKGLVLVLCAVDDKMSTSAIVYSNGECQDTYRCTSVNAHFVPEVQGKYDISLYLKEDLDNISCSMSTYDSDFSDIESGHIHTEKLSSEDVKISIMSEEGTEILSAELTENEARQLVRRIRN